MKVFYAGMIPDGNQISVLFPDVPGCQTWGSTPEEAFVRAVEALACHLQGMAEDGEAIPVPSRREAAWEKLKAECAELQVELPVDSWLQLVPAPELDLSPVGAR